MTREVIDFLNATFSDRDRAWGFQLMGYWLRGSVARWKTNPADWRLFLRSYLTADPMAAPTLAALVRRIDRVLPQPGARRPRRSQAPRWSRALA